LAFEAVTHGDADRVASNCYLELSATACGFAIRHVDYLSTDTRNTIRARAQFLVPQDARRKLPPIVAEIKNYATPIFARKSGAFERSGKSGKSYSALDLWQKKADVDAR